MGYFSSLASLNTFLLILVTQNRPKIPGKTKRIPLGGFPYFGASKLPVYPKINDFFQFPLRPHLNRKMGEKSVAFCPKIWRNFGFDPRHFSDRVFLDSNRGTGQSLILGYTSSLFAPKYGNPPSGMRFVVPGIFGLFCVTKINKKVFNEARLEKNPINTHSGTRFDFL